jgi:hypothetical protein
LSVKKWLTCPLFPDPNNGAAFVPEFKTSLAGSEEGHGFLLVGLKRQCHKIFDFSFFFHESVSPSPRVSHQDCFEFFSKIGGDIHSLRCTTGVNDTGGKEKNL